MKSQKQSDILFKKLKSYSCEESNILAQNTKKKKNIPELQFYPYNPRMIPEGVIPKIILEETKAKEENVGKEKKLDEECENKPKEKKTRGKGRKNKKDEKPEKNNEHENKIQDLVKNEEIEKNENNLNKEIFLNDDNNTNNYNCEETEIEKNDILNDNDPCLIIKNNNECLSIINLDEKEGIEKNENNDFEKNEKAQDDNYSMTSSQRDLENLLHETSEDNFDRIFQEKNNFYSNFSINNLGKKNISNNFKENDEINKFSTTTHKFNNDIAERGIDKEENVFRKNSLYFDSNFNFLVDDLEKKNISNGFKKNDEIYKSSTTKHKFNNDNVEKGIDKEENASRKNVMSSSSTIAVTKMKKETVLFERNKENFHFFSENSNFFKTCEEKKEGLSMKNSILNKLYKEPFKYEKEHSNALFKNEEIPKHDSNNILNKCSKGKYFLKKNEENKTNSYCKIGSTSFHNENPLFIPNEHLKFPDKFFSVKYTEEKKINNHEEREKSFYESEKKLSYIDDDEDLTLLDKILNEIEKTNNLNESPDDNIGLDELKEVDKVLFEHEENEKRRKMRFETEFILKKIKK